MRPTLCCITSYCAELGDLLLACSVLKGAGFPNYAWFNGPHRRLALPRAFAEAFAVTRVQSRVIYRLWLQGRVCSTHFFKIDVVGGPVPANLGDGP